MRDLFSVTWETRPHMSVYYRNKAALRNKYARTILTAYGASVKDARALLIQKVIRFHKGNDAMMAAIMSDVGEAK